MADLAAGLVCLSHDAAAAQEPALLQQVLAALRQLSAHWPSLLLPHAATLGTLLLQHPAQAPLGTAETRAALALLSSALQHLAGAPSGCHRQGLLPALLLLPMLQLTAFSSSKDVKQWSAHVLAHLQKLSNSPSGSGPAPTSGAPAGVRLHGPAAAAQAAEQLLHRLWHRPLEARHWLASLQLSLAGPPAGGSSGGGSRAVRDQQQLEGGVLLVLCALLQHGEEGVQRAALRAVGAALQATPLLGLSLLPLLVHELQRQVEAFLSGEHRGRRVNGWSRRRCSVHGAVRSLRPAPGCVLAAGTALCRPRPSLCQPLQASARRPPACCWTCCERCPRPGGTPRRCPLCCARCSLSSAQVRDIFA